MQRLGRNHGAYHGERVGIDDVLAGLARDARDHGWAADPMTISAELALPAWRRSPKTAARHVYLSAGIHGDEPAGPLAARQLVRENRWPADSAMSLCPCLNPTGFALHRRENHTGIDLNREYLRLQAPETRAHVRWLEQQPRYDIAICLHEDWEANGFYLYELNPDGLPSPTSAVIQAVAEVCPIDLAPEIEGRPAEGGIIRPSIDPRSRPEWPEAFYLLTHKTRLSYTLEAPSDFPLAVRVAALVRAVETLLGMPGAPGR